jgi:hypothetical protein
MRRIAIAFLITLAAALLFAAVFHDTDLETMLSAVVAAAAATAAGVIVERYRGGRSLR